MRNWTLATLGLATCMTVNAASFNQDVDRREINLDTLKGGVIAGITLGYMKPNYHNNGLVVVDRTEDGVTPYGRSEDIDYEHDIAYHLMLGWKFCDTPWDLRANLFHLDVDDSRTLARQGIEIFWNSRSNVHSDSDFISKADSANGKISFKLDAFDLEFSQHINMGCLSGMRLFWGASHHTLEQNTELGYVVNEIPDQQSGKSQVASFKSDFRGYGPRFGLDMDYYLGHSFGLVGQVSTTVLFGNLDSRYTTSVSPADKKLNLRYKNRSIVVPALDLKLGLDYTMCFCNGNSSELRFELGYWVKHYFDAVNQINVSDGENDLVTSNTLNSVSFHGLYLTLEGKA